MSETDGLSHPSSSELKRLWVIAGVVAASARFIPVPFADEMVRDRCRRFVVAKTLAHHGARATVDELREYHAGSGGCVGGCSGWILLAPLKLLLFPIRKIVAVVTSVRGVPLEITRTVLLGRTLDRRLREGDVDAEEAARMGRAFQVAFAHMDFRGSRAAIMDAISQAGHWRSEAFKIARWAARLPRRTSVETMSAELESNQTVDQAAAKIENALTLPETLKLFDDFDHRFDEAMKSLR